MLLLCVAGMELPLWAESPPERSPASLLAEGDPSHLALLHGGQGLPLQMAGASQQTHGRVVRLQPGQGHDLVYSLLLAVVYGQDPVLGRLVKKPGYISGLLLAAAVGVYGISLADGIYVYNIGRHHLVPSSFNAARERIMLPAELTIINSGLSIGSLAIASVWAGYYVTQIKKRKKFLKQQVDEVFRRLDQGATDSEIHDQLIGLLKNEVSAAEFLRLWHLLHPAPEDEIAPLMLESPAQALKRRGEPLLE